MAGLVGLSSYHVMKIVTKLENVTAIIQGICSTVEEILTCMVLRLIV